MPGTFGWPGARSRISRKTGAATDSRLIFSATFKNGRNNYERKAKNIDDPAGGNVVLRSVPLPSIGISAIGARLVWTANSCAVGIGANSE
jgi:hypothetical protein